jgi:hypothetical protein
VRGMRAIGTRLLAGSLVISLLTLAGAPIASAETAVAPAPAKPLAAAAAARGEALGAALAARPAINPQAAPPAAASDSKPFFKTTKGAVAIVAFIGATAFASWSLSHDRIKSPARQ